MKALKTTAAIALASAIAAPIGAPIAHAADHQTPIEGVFATFQKISTLYNIILVRMFVDMTYDTITVSPDGMSVSLSGAKIYPVLEWDDEGACVIEVDRLSSDGVLSFETLVSQMDISGVSVPAACFDPDLAGMMQGFGYDGLTADTMSVEIAYDLPSAGADISIQAAVVDAGDLSLSGKFDYLWVRIDPDGGGDPQPAALLGEAEIAFQNDGLWERLEPMAAAQFGDLSAVPQMAQMMLGQMLTEGGTRTPTEQENAFVENVATELGRFLEEKNRIVVTVAPEDGIWLEPDALESAPQAIEALRPEISATPLAYRSLIGPEALAAALGGGATLSDDERLRVGRALLTGIGAPRSITDGLALLKPLSDAWNGEAAALTAEGLQDLGDESGAYALALRAMAGGETSATGLADTLEAKMALADILALQGAENAAWPGAAKDDAAAKALVSSGDIAGMRKLAFAASIGKDRPRNYAGAYFWASLAAAGGDRGAANLRDRLDARLADRDDGGWRKMAAAQASQALKIWTSGGLGKLIYESVQ